MIKMFVTRKSPLDVNKAHGGDDEEDGEDADDGDKPCLGEHGLDAGDGELGVGGALVRGRGHSEAHPLTERSHTGSAINNHKISSLWPRGRVLATKLSLLKCPAGRQCYLSSHLLKAASLTL